MNRRTLQTIRCCRRLLLLIALTTAGASALSAQTFIPGSGRRVEGASDDFEDVQWSYTNQFPKSSYNIDKRTREPYGASSNGLWWESPKRGQPDVIKRVPTPAGGLPGSKGAMLMQSLRTGIPGRPAGRDNQDDLLFNGANGAISMWQSPSMTVRVFLPPWDQWEDRTGATFGWRAAVEAKTWKRKKSRHRRHFFSRRRRVIDQFYPGMFIQFNSKSDGENDKDSAVFIIRADNNGQDFVGPQITKTGWWTLGMSFTPDGHVHYYAHPGVGILTARDHIASSSYGGLKFERFTTFFFDIVNGDDGRHWSTPWIVDDPAIYVGTTPPRVQAVRSASPRR